MVDVDESYFGATRVNGIEGFWGLAKVRLAKFKGVPKHTFHLHLKETEWRYNHRLEDKYKTLLRYFRENPINWARPLQIVPDEPETKPLEDPELRFPTSLHLQAES